MTGLRVVVVLWCIQDATFLQWVENLKAMVRVTACCFSLHPICNCCCASHPPLASVGRAVSWTCNRNHQPSHPESSGGRGGGVNDGSIGDHGVVG